jgi:hypothetical protein
VQQRSSSIDSLLPLSNMLIWSCLCSMVGELLCLPSVFVSLRTGNAPGNGQWKTREQPGHQYPLFRDQHRSSRAPTRSFAGRQHPLRDPRSGSSPIRCCSNTTGSCGIPKSLRCPSPPAGRRGDSSSSGISSVGFTARTYELVRSTPWVDSFPTRHCWE